MGGGHISRPDFGMAQPDPAHPLTEFYLLVQQALDKAGCFALPALYASLQAPARRIYPEEAREYLRLAPQAGEGFVRLQAAVQMQVLYSSLQVAPGGAAAHRGVHPQRDGAAIAAALCVGGSAAAAAGCSGGTHFAADRAGCGGHRR